MIIEDGKQELTFVGKILRLILTICFLVTAFHKYNGDKIALMLMPCHFVTALYLYALWTSSKRIGHHVFNVAIHYQFFTWLALALPDLKGLDQVGEILNFWVHHWILFLVPVFLLATGFFKLDKSDHFYFRLAIFFGGLVHYDVMLMTSIVYGHNVSYMLYPPPKTPFKGTWFRFGHSAFLILMGWVGGYLVPMGMDAVAKRLRGLSTRVDTVKTKVT
eukprot:TRINITY_DN4781_c1_g1_i4.p1 TRINITY_DN4781_c1_g1~~TRINITY_DN4781_c1_g1_i4.p1  ORF type:complete len:218 (+),score=49.16 TRINITY_DN4781_c1_g1_i4:446-1099(+)